MEENKYTDTVLEDDTNETEFSGPYDPKDIDVNIEVVNLGFLLDMLENEEIDLTPEFQRMSDVWPDEKKSRLIESVLLGLPLPSFYFSEEKIKNDEGKEESKLVIVDGLQRLCAFKDFWIKKTLILKGLQFLPDMEGKNVKDLDRTQIRRFKSLKVTLNTLRKGTPTNVKFVIFQRVNSGGEPLKQQEMRNALYQGPATQLLQRMVALESFKHATGGKINEKRMLDRDFANRFVAFYLYRSEYTGELDAFMGASLEKINRKSADEIDDILNVFDRSMAICYNLLGKNAFRRPDPTKSKQYWKMNKTLFEVLSVTMAKISPEESAILMNRRDKFLASLDELFNDDGFTKSITSGTAKIAQVECRFKKMNQLINTVLNND